MDYSNQIPKVKRCQESVFITHHSGSRMFSKNRLKFVKYLLFQKKIIMDMHFRDLIECLLYVKLLKDIAMCRAATIHFLRVL